MDRQPDEVLLGFTVALRAAGVAVTHDRAQGYLAAAAEVGVGDARAAYHAGRATLCASPTDLVRFDQVYEAYFDSRTGLPRPRPAPSRGMSPSILPAAEADSADGREEAGHDVVHARASSAEVLRQRDVATLSASERHRLAAMFATLHLDPPVRRAARRRAWHRGAVDPARTLRASLRRLGEPGRIAWRRPGTRPRPIVLLVDVSGSMSSYADAILRLAHRVTVTAGPGSANRGRVETFSMGTRITPLSRALRTSDPERALVAAGAAVPDWSGGTRLGETLQAFVDRWGQRGLARGAVVVVFSDGWERGDPALLAEQMARLHRIAHRVVWVNPHRGKPGYEPVQGGVVAVLPHVDDFVAGHSLAAFDEVLARIARA